MRFKGLLGALALIVCMAAAPLAAETVQCGDREVFLTPFNSANPCGDAVVTTDETPLEFLLVFGPPPENQSGKDSSLRNRLARLEYSQRLATFGGLIDPPAGWEAKAAALASWGLGEPIFYAVRSGKFVAEYVRFPNALFLPVQAAVSAFERAPQLVLLQHQVKVIQAGYCLPATAPGLPGWMELRNSRNCGQGE